MVKAFFSVPASRGGVTRCRDRVGESAKPASDFTFLQPMLFAFEPTMNNLIDSLRCLRMTLSEQHLAEITIGVPSIDREHDDLMQEISRLLESPNIGLDSEHFSEIISRLGRQLAEHFRHEESFIEASGLSAHDVTAHQRAHREILEQYTNLQLDLMARVALDKNEVFEMIRAWIIEHLIAYDYKLRPYAALAGQS